jgi:hypothetical protein
VSFGLARSRLLVKVVESVKPCSVVEICLISVVKVEIFVRDVEVDRMLELWKLVLCKPKGFVEIG